MFRYLYVWGLYGSFGNVNVMRDVQSGSFFGFDVSCVFGLFICFEWFLCFYIFVFVC